MQKLFISIAVLFLSIGLIYYIGVRGTYKNDLAIGGNKYWVQIVDTDMGREKGLSDRYGMCAKCGMLFIFNDQNNIRFWMKDMRFDLDIIFLDKDKKVVKIYENVDRNKYPDTYDADAQYVLELNVDSVRSGGIVVGDVVNW